MEKEFIKIISEHQAIILKTCRMYCNDQLDSEDLFQEIILQLWRSYPKFNGASKVSTWMYRIGLNTAITRLRKNSRRRDTYPLSDKENEFPESDMKRIDLEYDRELQAAIDTLNKFDKALVMLYLDEKSYKDMAEIMGISESNIGVKINHIKQKLKTILNP
ncbi:MAG TPA: RNA polymerase subunit sigma-70 [Sphingobacteriaceae bacterium]|nr:RNA polymerase subunit sigma-70 [Sphingobacteriaceae bacterium]